MTVAKRIGTMDKCTLIGYNILLNEINGRMKSLNILDPTIQNVVVRVASTGKTKTLLLPRYTSLWKLRICIGEELGLGTTNFEIGSTEKYWKVNFEKEEDLSIAVIEYPKV
jgi:hypothetical protein